LERHGVQTLTACHAKEGADLARLHHPDVIVLDTEYETSELGVFCSEDGENGAYGGSSVILLGKVRRNPPKVPQGEFFAKPYHYGPLIRRIEEILDNIPRKVA
jgi:hypothetical protein